MKASLTPAKDSDICRLKKNLFSLPWFQLWMSASNVYIILGSGFWMHQTRQKNFCVRIVLFALTSKALLGIEYYFKWFSWNQMISFSISTSTFRSYLHTGKNYHIAKSHYIINFSKWRFWCFKPESCCTVFWYLIENLSDEKVNKVKNLPIAAKRHNIRTLGSEKWATHNRDICA